MAVNVFLDDRLIATKQTFGKKQSERECIKMRLELYLEDGIGCPQMIYSPNTHTSEVHTTLFPARICLF